MLARRAGIEAFDPVPRAPATRAMSCTVTPQTLKVHGLFRSGTNLAKVMIERCFDCRVSFELGGHKHLPLPYLPGITEAARIDTVVCVKDPLASLVSLFQYARRIRFKHFDCPQDWDGFLRSRLTVRIRADPSIPAFRFSHPADYWNAVYANALSLPVQTRFLLRYEDMLADPEAVIDALAAHFRAWPRRPEATCVLPAHLLGRSTEELPPPGQNARSFAARRDWYQSRTYLTWFNARQVDFMRQRLDPDVLAATGYALDGDAGR